jgi:hypothetical protein
MDETRLSSPHSPAEESKLIFESSFDDTKKTNTLLRKPQPPSQPKPTQLQKAYKAPSKLQKPVQQPT